MALTSVTTPGSPIESHSGWLNRKSWPLVRMAHMDPSRAMSSSRKLYFEAYSVQSLPWYR